MKRILPPSTIGIIGGGQLGKMMALAAKEMGYRVVVLDPEKGCPCAQVCDEHIVGAFNDVDAITRLCKKSDVVTYEFENVDAQAIKKLQDRYLIPQGSKCLEISQHRLYEKDFVKNLHIKTVPYRAVYSMEELKKAIAEIGYPAVLKTTRFGYDGKGQQTVYSEHDLTACEKLLNGECELEGFLSFDCEISAIVTRGHNTSCVFPQPQNIHKNGILQYSIVPNSCSEEINKKAAETALRIAEALQYIGTLAVEFFVKDDMLYFNEMAPRVHNSGHYTIEACDKSQFYTHIEAICGLRLSAIHRHTDAVMWNVLGQHVRDVQEFMKSTQYNQARVHLYGKKEMRHNRKVGHVTFYGDDVKVLFAKAKQIGGDEI